MAIGPGEANGVITDGFDIGKFNRFVGNGAIGRKSHRSFAAGQSFVLTRGAGAFFTQEQIADLTFAAIGPLQIKGLIFGVGRNFVEFWNHKNFVTGQQNKNPEGVKILIAGGANPRKTKTPHP